MPVTSVGKVFKPYLRLKAAQRAIQEDLRLHDPKAQITHDNHTLIINTDLNASGVEMVMANYSVKWRVEAS